MPSNNPNSINARKVGADNAAERAAERQRLIDLSTESTAGRGEAGVDEGNEAKSALQSKKGGPAQG